MTRSLIRSAVAAAFFFAIPASQASLGIFEYGNGVQSMAMGGVSYGYGTETLVLPSNPAHLATLGNRFDVGVTTIRPESTTRITGNAAGPDQTTQIGGTQMVYIPQGGYSRTLHERWAFGVSGYSAGLGPDYKDSPYQRFGGAQRASMRLTTIGVANGVAWRFGRNNSQAIGASLNLAMQGINLKGLGFLGSISETPSRVSDQGTDREPGAGFSVGWRGELLPNLVGGAGYRGKTWTRKHEKYRGILPDGGSLELPAIWGAGLAWSPISQVTVAFDFQRYEFGDEPAFSDTLSQLNPPNRLLGSKDGPAFGLSSINAYKLGLRWQVLPQLELRAGAIRATRGNHPSETLFASFAPVNARTHLTIGGVWQQAGWEFSGFGGLSLRDTVYGRNSIPPSFGGGESDVSYKSYEFGIALGRRFGG